MPTVAQIEQALFQLAPKDLAFDWDNVGHLEGSPDQEVQRVLVALDVTEAVAAEAVAVGANLIVAHHPLMNCAWHKVQHVTTGDAQGRTITTLLKNGVSAICMHTNLDAAEGGVNDVLAEKLGLHDTKPLTDEKIGRFGTLNCEKPLVEFLQDVIKYLGCSGLRYVDGGKAVHRVAVGGGACGDYIGQAIALGCDTFVTSDLSYHEFLDTKGLSLIDAGHFPTENVVCPVLAERLQAAFPHITVALSAAHDREIIQYCIKKEK